MILFTEDKIFDIMSKCQIYYDSGKDLFELGGITFTGKEFWPLYDKWRETGKGQVIKFKELDNEVL